MSDTATPERDLFYAIAERIEAEPHRHRQDLWRHDTECGTAYCIFGWAIVLSDDWKFDPNIASNLTRHVDDDKNDIRTVQNVARVLLGLSRLEGTELSASTWRPKAGMSVPEALRAIGDGATVASVTGTPGQLTLA